MNSPEYYRNRRRNLKLQGLCLDCQRRVNSKGVRCRRCAEINSKKNSARFRERLAVIRSQRPAKKTANERINQMLSLASVVIPPSSITREDIERRKPVVA